MTIRARGILLVALLMVAEHALSADAVPTTRTAPSFRGAGIAGVWMGFRQMPGSYEPHPRWYTFFNNGEVFEDLPDAGLLHFDRSASKAGAQRDYWGNYQYASGSGHIEKRGVRVREIIRAENPSQIKLDTDSFYRCVDVNGLRLDGAWTRLANPNDRALDRLPVGKRPIFQFTKDGRFKDGGVFATSPLSHGKTPQDAAGSGTYEIADFTLILRYSDGRVREAAFSGVAAGDPAVGNDIIYIGRDRFNKRR